MKRYQWLIEAISGELGNECMEWPFARASGPSRDRMYGVVVKPGQKKPHIRYTYAHRVALEYHTGKTIPEGQFALHRCDNPPCFNPKHLFFGTHKDNMEDKAKKGRLLFGERHQNSILTDAIVLEMRRQRASGMTCSAIARHHGVSSHKFVWKVVTRKLWPHL